MKIKSIIVLDEETGKEYAFTSRSVISVEEYTAENDPEVQGVSLKSLEMPTQSTKAVKVEVKSKKGKK